MQGNTRRSLRRAWPWVMVGVGAVASLAILPGSWGVAYGQTSPTETTTTTSSTETTTSSSTTTTTTSVSTSSTTSSLTSSSTTSSSTSTTTVPIAAAVLGNIDCPNASPGAGGSPSCGKAANTGTVSGPLQVSLDAGGGNSAVTTGNNLPANTTVLQAPATTNTLATVAAQLISQLNLTASQAAAATGQALTDAVARITSGLSQLEGLLSVSFTPAGGQPGGASGGTGGGTGGQQGGDAGGVVNGSTGERNPTRTQNSANVVGVINQRVEVNGQQVIELPGGATLTIRFTIGGGPGTQQSRLLSFLNSVTSLVPGLARPAPQQQAMIDPSKYVFLGTNAVQATPECPLGLLVLTNTVVNQLTREVSADTRCAVPMTLVELTNVPTTDDFDVSGGHFFGQASGMASSQKGFGYLLTDDGDVRFWSEFRRLGGVNVVGYPASSRTVSDGFRVQVMQKAVFQWRPELNQVWYANVFDEMHNAGKDDYLLNFRQIPAPRDTAPDAQLPGCAAGDAGTCWTETRARHLAFLDEGGVPQALREAYYGDADFETHWGLPMGVQDFGPVVVVRAQRAAFQYWKTDQPFAKAGTVSVVNGGDLSKEAGMWDRNTVQPIMAPPAAQAA